jgi:hypothetical protein
VFHVKQERYFQREIRVFADPTEPSLEVLSFSVVRYMQGVPSQHRVADFRTRKANANTYAPPHHSTFLNRSLAAAGNGLSACLIASIDRLQRLISHRDFPDQALEWRAAFSLPPTHLLFCVSLESR